jgi:sepiapterin reductase
MEVVFITGASRGYGRALALAFAKSAPGPTTLVLMARGAAGLEATRAAIAAAAPAAAVVLAPGDLADLPARPALWAAALAQLPAAWSRGLLLHNAGSAGRVGPLRAQPTDAAGVAALRATLDLDVLSPYLLSTLFLQAVAARVAGGGAGSGSALVNVSSLAAVSPFATLAPYSVTRAARDMLARVAGAEEAGGSGVTTLNYAPGPMDSELQREIRGAPACDAGIAGFFNDMAAKGTWVDMEASAGLCAKLVRTRAYESGAHLDYYDRVKAEEEAKGGK